MTAVVIDVEKGEIELEVSINFDAHFAASYGVEHGVVDRGGGVVHSFPLMWAEALDLLAEAVLDGGVDLGSLAAVAGSGQQHGTVYLNDRASRAVGELDADQPLAAQLADIFTRESSPIWMDTSTTATAVALTSWTSRFGSGVQQRWPPPHPISRKGCRP